MTVPTLRCRFVPYRDQASVEVSVSLTGDITKAQDSQVVFPRFANLARAILSGWQEVLRKFAN